MESWGKWKLVCVGFWLGIGFIVPQLVGMYSGTALTMLAMPSMMETAFVSGGDDDVSSFASSFDRADQIEIVSFRDQQNGKQLLILGSIVNNGDDDVSSVNLEAELTDKEGDFVYECSEYIHKKLKPHDTENFQIQCGCGANPIPAYAKINVRVVSASAF